MRTPLILGALCASLCALTFAGNPARAQDPATVQDPVILDDAPEIPPNSAQSGVAQSGVAQSGADLLLAARQALGKTYYYNRAPAEFAPAEKLRLQREMVAQNAPALALVRQALAAGIEIRPQVNLEDDPFTILAPAREMGQQLVQEADVRAADGDAMGAIDADFDALELGAQIGRNSFLASSIGLSIASFGRAHLSDHAPLLNAAQCRAVAQRWEKLDATRFTYPQVLQFYQAEQLRIIGATLPLTRTPDEAKNSQIPDDDLFKAEQWRQIMALTRPVYEANLRAVMQAALERAALPFQSAVQAAPIQGADPYSAMSADLLSRNRARFNFERNFVANRFVAAALRLRAAKLETGQYPEHFDAGVDPFSPTLAPLIYRRDGDKYALYSVGPDGKDDGGAEIQTLETDPETGVRKATTRLTPNSTGDIVAPVF